MNRPIARDKWLIGFQKRKSVHAIADLVVLTSAVLQDISASFLYIQLHSTKKDGKVSKKEENGS